MEKVLDKSCGKSRNTHFMLNNFYGNRAGYDIMCKNTGNIITRMRFARWITNATGKHSEYVILIAFPRYQWLRERTCMLRHKYTASLVSLHNHR